MAWTEAARAAALETRRANAAGRKQAQQRPQGQPKQLPGRNPAQMAKGNTNAGNRAAFALRNKMTHDAGKDQRIAAYAARQAGGAHQVGIHVATGGRMSAGAAALLGSLLGAGGAILRGVTSGGRR